MVGLLSQRGPKATISLVYCMARLPSTCRAGPTGSIGFAAAGAGEVGALLGVCAAAASFLFSSQPSRTAVERKISHTLRRRHKITPALLAAQIPETTSPARGSV